MDPQRKRVVVATTLLTVLSTGLALALGLGVYGNLGIQTVQSAYWYEESGHARVLVAGNRYESPESGPSYYRFGWKLFDPDTGESDHASWYAQTEGFPVGADAPKVLGVVGRRVIYLGDDGIEFRDGAAKVGRHGAALTRLFPNIATPWYSSQFVPPHALVVESDDRRRYVADLATNRATELADPNASVAPPACNGLDWLQSDGTVWTFVSAPPARHSDPNDMGLARAHRIEYGQLADVQLLDLRVPFGGFPCDGRTDQVALFPDGSALIEIWSGTTPTKVGFAKMGTDQRIAWRWMSEVEQDSNLVVRAFSHRGGFIVVVGSSVASLGPDGHVRWQKTV